jgi:hypothetical protein
MRLGKYSPVYRNWRKQPIESRLSSGNSMRRLVASAPNCAMAEAKKGDRRRRVWWAVRRVESSPAPTRISMIGDRR